MRLAQRNMGGVMPFSQVSSLFFYIDPGNVASAFVWWMCFYIRVSLVSVEIISDSL